MLPSLVCHTTRHWPRGTWTGRAKKRLARTTHAGKIGILCTSLGLVSCLPSSCYLLYRYPVAGVNMTARVSRSNASSCLIFANCLLSDRNLRCSLNMLIQSSRSCLEYVAGDLCQHRGRLNSMSDDRDRRNRSRRHLHS